MKKIKNVLSPLFVIFCLGLGFFAGIKQFLIYFFVVLIHEFSHYTVAKKLGYKLKNMYLMPYGICLNFNNSEFYANDELKIAIAGPVVNIMLSIFCVCLWWCFPSSYYYLDYFCFCNLVLGLFNLIPCFPLDGGRILVWFLSKNTNKQSAIKKTIILNYILCIFLIVMFFISILGEINFTYLYIAIFLFAGIINPEKYSKYKPIILKSNTKKVQKGVGVKIIAVSDNMPLYKILSLCSYQKYNIIYVVFNSGQVRVLSENNIINLCNKYESYKTIAQIVNIQKIKNF